MAEQETSTPERDIAFWKKDTLSRGFIIGLLTPVVALVAYYYAKIAPNSWADFFKYLGMEKRLLSSLTVICLVPNIALFTLFINTHRDQTAKGIFGVTLLFAIVSLLVKFVG
jgi:prepilin signal peptidase PulO-like enzyme (type II secretory pathway)